MLTGLIVVIISQYIQTSNHCVVHGPSPGDLPDPGIEPTSLMAPALAALQPPVFFLGEQHGQRSLMGCSPWSHKELDATEVT